MIDYKKYMLDIYDIAYSYNISNAAAFDIFVNNVMRGYNVDQTHLSDEVFKDLNKEYMVSSPNDNKRSINQYAEWDRINAVANKEKWDVYHANGIIQDITRPAE